MQAIVYLALLDNTAYLNKGRFIFSESAFFMRRVIGDIDHSAL